LRNPASGEACGDRSARREKEIQRGVPEGPQCRAPRLVRRQTAFTLFLFFQFKISAQLTLKVRIPLSDLPSTHLSFPRP
jgi:hypothetical protein